ncbi:MAG: hypothetical protein AAF456_00955 [Planctomycetota bacterium]
MKNWIHADWMLWKVEIARRHSGILTRLRFGFWFGDQLHDLGKTLLHHLGKTLLHHLGKTLLHHLGKTLLHHLGKTL